MKYWKFLLILIINGYIIQSCRPKDHHIVKEYDSKNRLVKKYSVNKRNQKDGEYREYYSDGTIWRHLNYSNDSLKGEQESFYQNGELQSKGYYINNHLDSILYHYYANKNLKSESFRLEGKSFGVQKDYRDNGKLSSLFFMMNDSDMAASLDFDNDGRIIKKDGKAIICIYEKKIIPVNDSLKAVFYTMLPPLYSYKCKILERKDKGDFQVSDCNLEDINNNKGVLIVKKYKQPGAYEIGLVLNLDNQKFRSSFTDSMFLSFKVQ